jgi:hypothetical protein
MNKIPSRRMFLERAELPAAMRPWAKRVSAKTDDLDADDNEFHTDIAGCGAPLGLSKC